MNITNHLMNNNITLEKTNIYRLRKLPQNIKKLSIFNRWNHNYWDNWNGEGPKKISGKFFTILLDYIFIWAYDLYPATEPYDIPLPEAS